MIWLALIWLGLIALWGASEAWSLVAARRQVSRVAHALPHALHHQSEPHPFDWAERAPSGPRPAGSRW